MYIFGPEQHWENCTSNKKYDSLLVQCIVVVSRAEWRFAVTATGMGQSCVETFFSTCALPRVGYTFTTTTTRTPWSHDDCASSNVLVVLVLHVSCLCKKRNGRFGSDPVRSTFARLLPKSARLCLLPITFPRLPSPSSINISSEKVRLPEENPIKPSVAVTKSAWKIKEVRTQQQYSTSYIYSKGVPNQGRLEARGSFVAIFFFQDGN
jgi:hypothetical protein